MKSGPQHLPEGAPPVTLHQMLTSEQQLDLFAPKSGAESPKKEIHCLFSSSMKGQLEDSHCRLQLLPLYNYCPYTVA